jgi:hypothetical protein
VLNDNGQAAIFLSVIDLQTWPGMVVGRILVMAVGGDGIHMA